MERPEVVILGGTGFVGRALCRLLASRRHWRIKVLTRDPEKAAAVARLPQVTIVRADVFSEADLRLGVQSADAIVNLIAILHGDPQAFRRVHVELAERIACARRDAGRARLVHVSALGVDTPDSSQYLQSKAEGERRLRAVADDAVTLRPSVIFGDEDRFINTFARLQRLAPVVPLPCSDAVFQPVWVEDVARAIEVCLHDPACAGRIVQCVGPNVFSLREIVARSGRWANARRPILPLPWTLAVAQAWLMEKLPGTPVMSRDNLRSMQVPNVAQPGVPTLQDLGIAPRSLDDYLGLR